MKHLILLFILISTVFACSQKESVEPYQEELRIKNNTPYELKSVTIKIGDSQNTFDAVQPNQTSDYKLFKDKGYPSFSIEANNKTYEFKIMPIDLPPTEQQPAKVKPKPLTCVISSTTPDSFDVHFVE